MHFYTSTKFPVHVCCMQQNLACVVHNIRNGHNTCISKITAQMVPNFIAREMKSAVALVWPFNIKEPCPHQRIFIHNEI